MDASKIKKSARARLNEAGRDASRVLELVAELRAREDGTLRQELRNCAENLLQCVHEANAYNNAGGA